MASRIIGNVMSTVLAYVYGKFIVAIFPIQILALLRFHPLLFDRWVLWWFFFFFLSFHTHNVVYYLMNDVQDMQFKQHKKSFAFVCCIHWLLMLLECKAFIYVDCSCFRILLNCFSFGVMISFAYCFIFGEYSICLSEYILHEKGCATKCSV